MKSFSDLFKNVLKAMPIETAVRDFLMEYLKNNCGITIDRKDIHLQKNTIELRVPPMVRAKFFPHCSMCVEKLNEFLKEKEIQLVIKKIM